MTTKRCSNCAHAMDSEIADQVYCIAHPPTPVATRDGTIVCAFAQMKMWGKCDEFLPGDRQKQNSPEAA